MLQDAVEIECEFINESISCGMIGMNTKLMTQYVKYVADQLLLDIDLKPLYNATNPFPFMAALGLVDRSNFFESRESVYQKPVQEAMDYDSDDDDF
jgi:ribonucleoside-diphosphate reductase subunit M2